jgi:hypothetical protein
MPEGLGITCASRSVPLSSTGTFSATWNLRSPVAVSGKRGIRWWGGTEAVVRCHNPTGLWQCSMRLTRINLGFGLSPQGGSMSSPEPETPWDQSWQELACLTPWRGIVLQEDRKRQAVWAAQETCLHEEGGGLGEDLVCWQSQRKGRFQSQGR